MMRTQHTAVKIEGNIIVHRHPTFCAIYPPGKDATCGFIWFNYEHTVAENIFKQERTPFMRATVTSPSIFPRSCKQNMSDTTANETTFPDATPRPVKNLPTIIVPYDFAYAAPNPATMAIACENMSTGRRPYTLLMGAQIKLPRPAAAMPTVPA
jgi:hypothetical protein